MSYKFRLASIQRLRERERDKAAQALQQAQMAKQKLEQQIEDLETESRQLIALRGSASVGQVDVQRVIDAQRYQMNLLEKIHGIRGNIDLIEQEIEKRRAKLVLCEQGVKVLEKLDEKQHGDWVAQQAERTQSRLDEWASFHHYRRASES